MTGVRRTAVPAAAILLFCASWATAESQRQHVLPAGTAVVFVTDASMDAGRREGDVVTVHLRDNLVFDGAVLAAAGTHAVLIVGGTGPSDKRVQTISLDRFTIAPGLMPLRAAQPLVAPIPAGTQIEAATLADVDHLGDRYSIRIPFPFTLTGDQPSSAYTPTPARTASPRTMMRPSPRPSVTPTPLPEPTASTVPAPAGTMIPSR